MMQRPDSEPGSDGDSPTAIKRCILIVDDDDELLAVMVALVESWGCTALHFNQFEAARTVLLEGVDAHALLVDVRIGGFNGLHLVHLARRLYPFMTVVAMTGFEDPVLRAEAKKAGAAYLLKPVPPQELQRTLLRDLS
jgi:DNA-binding NtrC family response regulator